MMTDVYANRVRAAEVAADMEGITVERDHHRLAATHRLARVRVLEEALRKVIGNCRACGGNGYAGTHDVPCFWCGDSRAALSPTPAPTTSEARCKHCDAATGLDECHPCWFARNPQHAASPPTGERDARDDPPGPRCPVCDRVMDLDYSAGSVSRWSCACKRGSQTSTASAQRGEAKGPVCATCNDTHVMNEKGWACTRCPVPCQKCRYEGHGSFCQKTPCDCDCHAPPPEATAGAAKGERK